MKSIRLVITTLFLGAGLLGSYSANAQCNADFSWTANGLTVDFINLSSGDFSSVYWASGAGPGSSVYSPMFTYPAAGTYYACLYLYDSLSVVCDSVCDSITVSPAPPQPCVADFDFNTTGLTVAFTNLSLGNYTVSDWDFGDVLGSSTNNNPTYTYLAAGTYNVCLTISDPNDLSCLDVICKDVTVSTGGGGDLCNANFFYSTEELSIDVSNTSTGSFITSLWDYGDGSLPTFNTSYTYADPGEYEVCLTIINPIPFCTDQHCEIVEVLDLYCEPSFTFDVDYVNNTVSFTNTTATDNYTSLEWEFGDGNTSTFDSPSYGYGLPGTYQVCLYTYNEGLLCGIACQDVEVSPLGLNSRTAVEVNVYPNPSDGNLTIEHSRDDDLMLQLQDIAGRTVSSQLIQGQQVTLDVNPGIYLLKLMSASASGELVHHQRLVVE